MNERVRALRLDLRLTQVEFGARLGVSRDVIKRIERNDFTEQSKLPLIKLMAKEFSVSEDWLLYGDTAAPEYTPYALRDCREMLIKDGATEFEAAFVASYLTFDTAQREAILDNLVRSIEYADNAVRRMEQEKHNDGKGVRNG